MAFSKLTEPVGTDRMDLRKGLHTQKSVLFQLLHCQSTHLFAKGGHRHLFSRPQSTYVSDQAAHNRGEATTQEALSLG